VIGVAPSFAPAAARWMTDVHDALTAFFVGMDGGGNFTEERWERPGGGGGVSRVLLEGKTFEQSGVNRSEVTGVLERGMAGRLALAAPPPEGARFFATGVSMVTHPRSPLIPTVHLNIRYFELTTADGEPFDAWFGGGTDLTPTWPCPDDARHWHRTLAEVCDAHDPVFYPRFKAWCDDYFRNTHRGGEARGVGGVFFDHLRPGREGLPERERLAAFVNAIGRALPAAYGPIVDRYRDTPWGERERTLQLERWGRYVEFNLLHDRGTHFGLQSGARVESILMSLPPLARWSYGSAPQPGSPEAALSAMLVPQDWVSDTSY